MATKKKTTEIERRWYVREIDARLLPRKSQKAWLILQGYLELRRDQPSSVRVRIVRKAGSMAVKSGKGLVRGEVDRKIPLDLAQVLMTLCRLRVNKTRTFYSHWELDTFHGSLAGLVFLEREFKHYAKAKSVRLPRWVLDAVDVTEFISSRDLARLATRLSKAGGDAREAVERIIATHARQ